MQKFTSIISGDRPAFVGIGGGSDCIQAAILALLSGKPACAISIRTAKTLSQSADGTMGEARTVTNHGGEIMPGVFRITPESGGSGRFLEFIPAHKIPVYLVVDHKDERLARQIQAVLDDFQADTVIAVDTGGDSLYRTTVTDASKATPDQDVASLSALCELAHHAALSCVVANGIDSPDYADAVLSSAQADFIAFTEDETLRILALYKEFQLDGTYPDRYGKTAFAWQAALRGETGLVRLPLPEKVINDPANPWNPHVEITREMAGCYVMNAQDHLDAIRQ